MKIFPTNMLLEIKGRGLGKKYPKGTRFWIDKINVCGKEHCGSGIMLHVKDAGIKDLWLDSGWFKDLSHINKEASDD